MNQCESELVKPDELSSKKKCPLCSKTLSGAEETIETHVCNHNYTIVGNAESLPSVGNLRSSYFDEPLGSRRTQPQRNKTTRTTRRKAVDPCDLSLALALSESMQSANESARKQEEELLLTVQHFKSFNYLHLKLS